MSTIQPRTSVVTIYQGDHLDRIRHLELRYTAMLEAEKGEPRTLDAVPESQALAEEHKALVAEADASAIQATVQALPRKVWRALVASHPPRKDDSNDEAAGVNEDTFKDALVVAHGEIDGREFSTVIDLSDEDIEALSDIDFDRLYFTAFALNRSAALGPKALVSPSSQASDATLN